jgi:hypothetical protein
MNKARDAIDSTSESVKSTADRTKKSYVSHMISSVSSTKFLFLLLLIVIKEPHPFSLTFSTCNQAMVRN